MHTHSLHVNTRLDSTDMKEVSARNAWQQRNVMRKKQRHAAHATQKQVYEQAVARPYVLPC